MKKKEKEEEKATEKGQPKSKKIVWTSETNACGVYVFRICLDE